MNRLHEELQKVFIAVMGLAWEMIPNCIFLTIRKIWSLIMQSHIVYFLFKQHVFFIQKQFMYVSYTKLILFEEHCFSIQTTMSGHIHLLTKWFFILTILFYSNNIFISIFIYKNFPTVMPTCSFFYCKKRKYFNQKILSEQSLRQFDPS